MFDPLNEPMLCLDYTNNFISKRLICLAQAKFVSSLRKLLLTNVFKMNKNKKISFDTIGKFVPPSNIMTGNISSLLKKFS